MIKQKYKHFIITHFNLRLIKEGGFCFAVDKKNNPTQTDEWMAHRFDLFETYCFPSIAEQTDKEFYWICLFDELTNTTYREKIKGFQQRCDRFIPVFLPEVKRDDLHLDIDKVMRNYLDGSETHVVSTNLDNDDALHIDFIKTFRKHFNNPTIDTVYRFTYGYQYFTTYNYLMQMKYPHNHFLTLATAVTEEPMRDISYYNHTSAHRQVYHIDIIEKPLWLEVVHTGNVSNSLRVKFKIKYKPIISNKSLLDEFNIDKRIKPGKSLLTSVTTIPRMVFEKFIDKIKRMSQKAD